MGHGSDGSEADYKELISAVLDLDTKFEVAAKRFSDFNEIYARDREEIRQELVKLRDILAELRTQSAKDSGEQRLEVVERVAELVERLARHEAEDTAFHNSVAERDKDKAPKELAVKESKPEPWWKNPLMAAPATYAILEILKRLLEPVFK